MTVFCVHTLSFDPPVVFPNKCTNVNYMYNETICNAYVCPRLGEGQGQSLRLNTVWLYFESALYLLNPWWDLQITFLKCKLWLYPLL